jgi:glutathione synthase/RimK-type ligase-like ATP-grasp enzyme
MNRKTVAFLTMQDPGDYVTDYHLCLSEMSALGWTVREVAWRDTAIDWADFDAVYLCTAWDYPLHVEEFFAVLERIAEAGALLVNNQSLVRWNIRKSYLRDLASRGADIVPSLWVSTYDAADIPGWFATLQADTVVIKPEVGANAQDTFVLRNPLNSVTDELLQTTFQRRSFLVQPFVESICSEGEFSLFFFAGEFSHAILKMPAAGDFRSQEEHGASIHGISPDAALLQAGSRVAGLIEPQPVYARIDLVRGSDGRFLLMELELIEPSLYFRMDEAAPARFAAAFDKHVSEQLR